MARPADWLDCAANGDRYRSRASSRRRTLDRPFALCEIPSSCVTLLSNAICVPTNAIYKQTQRTRCDREKHLNTSIAYN